MSTTDLLALAALVLTIIGWVATLFIQLATAQKQAQFQGNVQKQLELMKEEFALAREHRQFVLPDQMAGLKRIMDLLIAAHLLMYDIWLFSMLPSGDADTTLDELEARVIAFNKEFDMCMAVAIQYGPSPMSLNWDEATAAGAWRDTGGLPDSLPLLLDAVQESIGTSISVVKTHEDASETTDSKRAMVERLYLHGIQLVNDLRRSIFAGNK